MNPCLKIIKCEGSQNPTEVSFVVVDLDLSRNYPENFVCILPRSLSSPNNADCIFMKVFSKPNKEAAKEMAKRLLEKALTVYPKLKPEIEERLETLLKPRCARPMNRFLCRKSCLDLAANQHNTSSVG